MNCGKVRPFALKGVAFDIRKQITGQSLPTADLKMLFVLQNKQIIRVKLLELLLKVILVGGWLPWLWYACSSYPMASIVFLAVNSLVDTVIDLPWDMYDTFVIEEKHGFNKQTLGFYAKDKVFLTS